MDASRGRRNVGLLDWDGRELIVTTAELLLVFTPEIILYSNFNTRTDLILSAAGLLVTVKLN